MPKKRILILDDEESLREFLAAELRSKEYDVLSMESKLKAFDLLMQWRPDMILSDIKSPLMDGWEFLRWVRANPYAAKVSFVFLTGFADLANAIKSKQLGADDFISKPYDLKELLGVVDREFAWQQGPAWDPPPSFGDQVANGTLYCLPWRHLANRWRSALRSSPFRTAVISMTAWVLDFVVDDGGSLTVGRLIRPIDPQTRYSAECVHSLLDHYGAEKGIFYILTPHSDHETFSSRARIATAEETASVFAAGIFAPDLDGFER